MGNQIHFSLIMDIAQKTITNIIWNFMDRLCRRGIGFITTMILAYFLQPSDFGLVAMTSVFITIGQSVMDSGFYQALIQRREVTKTILSTAFISNIALGLLSYAVLFLCAPLIAHFYQQDALINIIRIVGLVIIFQSFQSVQLAQLARDMRFKTQMMASVPASLLSAGLAIYLAYTDFGVWAMVCQMVAFSAIQCVLVWVYHRWMPTFVFDKGDFKSLYQFGYKLFLAGLLDTIFKNAYVIVIAKLFDAASAGYYFFAEKIRDMLVNQIIQSVQSVTYPAFATMQGDDYALRAAYRKTLKHTMWILCPGLGVFIVVMPYLFTWFLPEKWMDAVPYVQLICAASLFHPIHAINLNILKVKDRTDLYLRLEIFKKVMMAFILALSIPYGITGILIGQIIFGVLATIPNSRYSEMLIDYTQRDQLMDVLPAIGVCGLVIIGGGYILW